MSGTGRLKPGAILLLAEQDYCYGTGPLKLRIDKLGADPASLPRLEWVRIVGMQIHPDNSEQERDVMARVESLQRSVLPEHPHPRDHQPTRRSAT